MEITRENARPRRCKPAPAGLINGPARLCAATLSTAIGTARLDFAKLSLALGKLSSSIARDRSDLMPSRRVWQSSVITLSDCDNRLCKFASVNLRFRDLRENSTEWNSEILDFPAVMDNKRIYSRGSGYYDPRA